MDGKRGPGGFPAPLGVVGEGVRVWPWSVALEWFDHDLGVDLDVFWLSLPPQRLSRLLRACAKKIATPAPSW